MGSYCGISSLKRLLTIIVLGCLILTSLHLLLVLKHGEYSPGRFALNFETYDPFRDDSLVIQYGNDTLIDHKGFQFLQHNEKMCDLTNSSTGSDNILLILIMSSPDNLDYRDLVRNTWASVSSIEDWNVKYGFLLGMTPDAQMNLNMSEESHGKQDLIIGNFIDTYSNLSYKQIMGYKWALKFCPQAKFVLKTDNDVFVDVFQLVDTVTSLKETNTIACHVNYNVPVVRDIEDKWYVSPERYPRNEYPTYCPGMGFILSFDLLQDFVKASENLPYFGIEDAYGTGILREYVKNVLGTPVDLVDIHTKYIFSDGDPYISWLYRRRCTDAENRLPWIFVHCWSEDIFDTIPHLWKLVLTSNMERVAKHSQAAHSFSFIRS